MTRQFIRKENVREFRDQIQAYKNREIVEEVLRELGYEPTGRSGIYPQGTAMMDVNKKGEKTHLKGCQFTNYSKGENEIDIVEVPFNRVHPFYPMKVPKKETAK